MFSIYTDVIINANINDVWKVISDPNTHRKWNQFPIIKGDPRVDRLITLNITLGNRSSPGVMRVIEYKENEKVVWFGLSHQSDLISNIFSFFLKGEHSLMVEKISENQTKFINKENFTGILTTLPIKKLFKTIEEKYRLTNVGLKKYCEDENK